MRADMPRRLACALATACRIPESGSELVPVLGTGRERDNLEALEHWVSRQLLEPDEALAVLILNRLLDRLEGRLQSLPFGGRQYG